MKEYGYDLLSVIINEICYDYQKIDVCYSLNGYGLRKGLVKRRASCLVIQEQIFRFDCLDVQNYSDW